MGTTSVDPYALRLAAARLDDAADLLNGAMRGHLAGLSASEPLDRLLADLTMWQWAAQETAVTLRTSADLYADAERLAAGRFGEPHVQR